MALTVNKPSCDELWERNKFLVQEVSDLRQTCQEQENSARLLDAIRKAQSLFIVKADPSEIYSLLLDTLIEITASEYGFLDEVIYEDHGETLKKSLAISNLAWNKKSRDLYRQLQEKDLIFSYLENLAGLPALTGKTIISNNVPQDNRSKGLPEGHPPIRTFLGMPLFFGGTLICVAGVANRESGYDENLALFLEPLLNTCAGITFALRKIAIEKENKREIIKQSEELKKLNTALEVLLDQRNKELNNLRNDIYRDFNRLVLPDLIDLKTRLKIDTNKKKVSFIITNFQNIFSPFLEQLSSEKYGLTKQELKIASLIQSHMTSEDISEHLNISINTVNFHRKNLRKKLGIHGKNQHLAQFLNNLPK